MSGSGAKRKLDASGDAKILALFQAGVLLQEIADQLHVSRETVRQSLRRQDQPLRRRSGPASRVDDVEVLAHYQAGQNPKDIAQALQLSRESVYVSLRRQNQPVMRQGHRQGNRGKPRMPQPGRPVTWIGRRVQGLRLQANLSQQGLADRAGVTLARVEWIEKEGKATLKTVDRVCCALGITLSKFFEGYEGERENETSL